DVLRKVPTTQQKAHLQGSFKTRSPHCSGRQPPPHGRRAADLLESRHAERLFLVFNRLPLRPIANRVGNELQSLNTQILSDAFVHVWKPYIGRVLPLCGLCTHTDASWRK